MLTYIVSKIPPEYASPPDTEQVRLKYSKEITWAALAAVESVSKNPSHSLSEDRNRSFKSLLEQIVGERSLDFRQYHQGVVKRKIAMRMRVNKLESYPEYGCLLTKRPEEFDKLLEDLCI